MISPRYAITAALALAFIAGAAPHVLGWTTYWVSYVDSLRLRETPDVNGRVIGTLPKGVPAWQTETEGKIAVVNGIRNRWIKVMHGDREGYAFGGYLVAYNAENDKAPSVSISRKTIPVGEWMGLKSAHILAEPEKGVCYLDESEAAPLYRNQPRAVISLDKSFKGKSGLKADFTNRKTVFFNYLNYHHPGEYGATGYFLFTHPDHGKVWVADCHAHQVADTLKWKDTIVVLGTSQPLWEGDRSKYRLMLWNVPGKKFVYGTLSFPKVAHSYARARFLFNNEKDGALHLQIEARNETQGEEYSGNLTFTHPFYSIYAVVTESGVGEISRYEMTIQ